MTRIKDNIYLAIFIITAVILGVGVWNNYRPQVIYASCTDIAEKTTFLIQKKDIVKIDMDNAFNNALNECLLMSGYFDNR